MHSDAAGDNFLRRSILRLSMSEIAGMLPLIEKMKAEGITLIMIEHRLRELFRVADRVMALNFGERRLLKENQALSLRTRRLKKPILEAKRCRILCLKRGK